MGNGQALGQRSGHGGLATTSRAEHHDARNAISEQLWDLNLLCDRDATS